MCCSTFDLCDRHPARCLPAVCARGGAAHSPPPSDHLMNRVRRPPLQHPLALLFDRAVDSLCVALSDETIRHYRGTVRNFLSYLGADHPGVQRLDQLRREPHILGWMSRLHSQVPPLGTTSYIIRLITLRPILNELAWTEQLPELAHLLRREDIPRAPQRLPRPLTAEQDQLLQQEFLRRNELGGNVFLLMRHTGMRIGECADLSVDCLRSTGPNQWAIHVPLGKLKTERMVPVDSFVRELVQRLRFFRSLDPLPADGRLLARPGAKDTLLRNFRDYLNEVCHSLVISIRIVPHLHKCIKPLVLRPPANRRLRQRFATTQANSGENRSYHEGHRTSDRVMLGGQNGEEQQAHAGCSKNWRSNGES